MAKEKKGSRWRRPFAPVAWALGPRSRWIVAPLAALVFLAGGLHLAWRLWGSRAAAGRDYVVTADAITITPQPAWIHGDVKAEVIHSGGLDGLPLRDPQLVEHVQRAFSLHGWVARVKRVRKLYPASITVDLEYRQPVGMVEVTWRGQPSLYFVDADGVLLPKEDHGQSDDQRREEYERYVRIDAGDASAAGRIAGQPWDSGKVAGAARLAALGQDQWGAMGVYRIVASEDLNSQPVYELEARNAARVLWGHAPGAEAAGEAEASTKWQWLKKFIAQHGPLDKSAEKQRVDLRSIAEEPASSTATTPPLRDADRR